MLCVTCVCLRDVTNTVCFNFVLVCESSEHLFLFWSRGRRDVHVRACSVFVMTDWHIGDVEQRLCDAYFIWIYIYFLYWIHTAPWPVFFFSFFVVDICCELLMSVWCVLLVWDDCYGPGGRKTTKTKRNNK